jgi:hypothetical protein
MSSPSRGEVTRPVVFRRWQFKVRGAGNGLSCRQKVVKGDYGVDSSGS